MTRYVYIKEPIVLLDGDDEPLKTAKGDLEKPITMYRWFVTNCLPIGVNLNRETGQQVKVGPGKAFGEGDKAARAISHIKKTLKNATPGTYAALEHSDWVLWKKCCEEADWNPGVSAQFLEFIDAVLDAKETVPKVEVVPAELAAPPTTPVDGAARPS